MIPTNPKNSEPSVCNYDNVKTLKNEQLNQILKPILSSSILSQKDVKTRQNETNHFNKK